METINKAKIPKRKWTSSGLNYETSIQPRRYLTNVNKAILQTKSTYNTDVRYTGNRSYVDESAILESQSVYAHPEAYIRQPIQIDAELSYKVPRSGNQPRLMQTARNTWFQRMNNVMPQNSSLSSLTKNITQNNLPAMSVPGADDKNKAIDQAIVQQQRAATAYVNLIAQNEQNYLTQTVDEADNAIESQLAALDQKDLQIDKPNTVADVFQGIGNALTFGLVDAIANPIEANNIANQHAEVQRQRDALTAQLQDVRQNAVKQFYQQRGNMYGE